MSDGEQAQKIHEDALRLLAYMDELGLEASAPVARGHRHMGGLIVESALQRRQRYAAVVAPRVKAVMAAWPEADTTTGFLHRLDAGELAEIIRWKKPARLEQMRSTAELLQRQSLETVEQLRERLSDEATRPGLRRELRRIRNVGPKTLDYIDIMVGLTDSAAIDSRIRRATFRAGITATGYDHLAEVLRCAASLRGWRVGDLDSVLWRAHST